jgi:hypothetical protein
MTTIKEKLGKAKERVLEHASSMAHVLSPDRAASTLFDVGEDESTENLVVKDFTKPYLSG